MELSTVFDGGHTSLGQIAPSTPGSQHMEDIRNHPPVIQWSSGIHCPSRDQNKLKHYVLPDYVQRELYDNLIGEIW